MTRDAWLAPETCGMRLAEFERLTQLVTRAGQNLEDLSHALCQALNRAGVSTAPAMEIARAASWARQAGPDLQRRNRLVHDMDRAKLSVGVCRAEGTYVLLPDRYGDQLAQLHGREAAELLRRAAAGDRKALSAVWGIGDDSGDPVFAKALLERLGAAGLSELPIDLAERLRADINGHRGDLDGTARDTRAALALLRQTLAVGTDPASGQGYVGDEFLARLRDAGRLRFPPGSAVPQGLSGYQGLSAVLDAGGSERFSVRFMEVVGRDMIAYDQEVARRLPGTPLPGLGGWIGLGNALDPGTEHVRPPDRTPLWYETHSDFLLSLMNAAGQSKSTAQALLKYTPAGQKNSYLEYLLHERRAVWAATDHGAALGATMKAAMADGDATSQTLFEEAVKLLGHDTRRFLTYKDGHQLSIGHQDEFDQLKGLRPAMGDILVAHLGGVSDRLFSIDSFGHLGGRSSYEREANLLAVLADAVQDDAAFQTLATAQIGHMRAWLDRQYASGRPVDVGVAAETQMLGYLLALRRESMLARGENAKASNQQIKDLVAKGIGWVPIPYADKLGGAAKDLYTEVVTHWYTQAGDWLATAASDRSVETNTEPHRLTDEQASIDLTKQMLLYSAVHNLDYSAKDVEGQIFAQNEKIIPPETWTNAQAEAFGNWCKEKGFSIPVAIRTATETINGAHDKAVQSFIASSDKP